MILLLSWLFSLKGTVILAEAILFERVLIAFTEDDFKVIAHSLAEFLELARVWCQDRDLATLVYTLTDNMTDECVDHTNFPRVGFRLAVVNNAILSILDIAVVKPK